MLGSTASADLLPTSPLPAELRVTFEIVSADAKRKLPEELRQIEGGRLTAEETTVNGAQFRKETTVLPLPNGDTRERVIYFAEEDGRLRMLGFHRIRRHLEQPSGETLVFDSGGSNPMSGTALAVPADTYTYLGLTTALAAVVDAPAPVTTHLWIADGRVVPATIVSEGHDELGVLGTRVPSRRVRVKPAGGEEALYWFTEESPHSFLQYRGPGGLFTETAERSAAIVVRVTSSSAQVEKIFRD